MASPAVSWFGSPADGGEDLPRRRRQRILASDAQAVQAALPPAGDAIDVAPLVAIRGGDGAAFQRLYETYSPELWEFASYLLRDADAGHDVVQDVFASIWTRRDALDLRDGTRAYLFRAVRNIVSKRRRHAAVRQRTEDDPGNTVEFPQSHGSTDPAETLDARTLERAVEMAVRSMPDARRLAATLRLRHGLTDRETAAVMGISVAAVQQHVARARAALRPLVARYREK